uniref:DAG1 domain-containing protein n=1 Tax=Panagrellus redivivus TaxID=6233 RepID=A0A7E4US85_PANRE
MLAFMDSLFMDTDVVEFDKNGCLTVMLKRMSDASTMVKMPNAEIYVPEKPTTDGSKEKGESNAGIYIVVACVVVFLLILISIGIAISICVIRKKSNPHPVPVEDPIEIEIQETYQIEPEFKIHALLPSSPATPVTERKTEDRIDRSATTSTSSTTG